MFAGIPRSSMKTFFWACDGCVNSASGFHLKRLVAGDVPGLGSCVSAMRHLSGSFQAFRILKCFLDLETPPKKKQNTYGHLPVIELRKSNQWPNESAFSVRRLFTWIRAPVWCVSTFVHLYGMCVHPIQFSQFSVLSFVHCPRRDKGHKAIIFFIWHSVAGPWQETCIFSHAWKMHESFSSYLPAQSMPWMVISALFFHQVCETELYGFSDAYWEVWCLSRHLWKPIICIWPSLRTFLYLGRKKKTNFFAEKNWLPRMESEFKLS